ncbi:hypothetical protein [Clostridium estertheticum]|nr:hypothetical protein [Clostridium estertheticum]MBU3157602.1 hypothetical protein [Clostridium estertheticum]
MIEEKLKWSEYDIKKSICTNVFIENVLGGLLGILDMLTIVSAVYYN